jgi:hypothetical protein
VHCAGNSCLTWWYLTYVVVGFSHLRHLKPPQQPELQSPLHSQQQLSFTQPAASSRHSLHRRLYCCCLSRIFLHQVPLMRDPETMLGHCVSCHQVFDAEGNLIQVKTPLTPPPAPPSRPASAFRPVLFIQQKLQLVGTATSQPAPVTPNNTLPRCCQFPNHLHSASWG